MYYTLQRYRYDQEGYPVQTISHLSNGKKLLCGLKPQLFGSNYKYIFASKEMKEGIIEKTTYKSCKKIANKLLGEDNG